VQADITSKYFIRLTKSRKTNKERKEVKAVKGAIIAAETILFLWLSNTVELFHFIRTNPLKYISAIRAN
jgi:hypothetical protein